MKKFVTCMLILSLSAAALSGCTITVNTPENSTESTVSTESSAEESAEESADESTEESSEEESKADESSDESSAEESDDILTPADATGKDLLFTWQIKLDGKTYTVPFDYSEVVAMGYSIKPEEDTEIKANTYYFGVYPKNADGISLSVEFWNPSSTPKKVSECKIGEFEVGLDDGMKIEMPGGFKFDANITPEAVKEMYGEPDDTYSGDGYVTLTYRQDIYQKVEFFVYTDSKMLKYSNVKIQNFASESDLPEISSEPTEESAEEESSKSEESSKEESSKAETSAEPASGTGKEQLFSWEIKYNGNTYRIPVDFSEFKKLGYSIKAEEDKEVGKNTYTIGVTARNADGKSLNAQFWNGTSTPKKASECQVGSIEIEADDGIDLELPGGFKLSETVTPEYVKSIYGEPDDTIEGDGYVTLTYKQGIYNYVRFFVYTDSKMKKYTHVEIENFETE